MAKPLTSWLVPSFSQHNRHLVVSGHCLHVSVTKFQDKFASLRQVNSPYSWSKFQIIMLYRHVFDKISTECRGIFRVFVYFAEFRRFTWISRLRDRAKYQKPWPLHASCVCKCSSNWYIARANCTQKIMQKWGLQKACYTKGNLRIHVLFLFLKW